MPFLRRSPAPSPHHAPNIESDLRVYMYVNEVKKKNRDCKKDKALFPF